MGVLVACNKLHVIDWLPVYEKLLKRLEGWKGSALSFGGGMVLINSYLSSIPPYCILSRLKNHFEKDG
jgi:hypothetical protein